MQTRYHNSNMIDLLPISDLLTLLVQVTTTGTDWFISIMNEMRTWRKNGVTKIDYIKDWTVSTKVWITLLIPRGGLSRRYVLKSGNEMLSARAHAPLIAASRERSFRPNLLTLTSKTTQYELIVINSGVTTPVHVQTWDVYYLIYLLCYFHTL